MLDKTMKNQNAQNQNNKSIKEKSASSLKFKFDDRYTRYIGKRSGKYLGQVHPEDKFDYLARYSDYITYGSDQFSQNVDRAHNIIINCNTIGRVNFTRQQNEVPSSKSNKKSEQKKSEFQIQKKQEQNKKQNDQYKTIIKPKPNEQQNLRRQPQISGLPSKFSEQNIKNPFFNLVISSIKKSQPYNVSSQKSEFQDMINMISQSQNRIASTQQNSAKQIQLKQNNQKNAELKSQGDKYHNKYKITKQADRLQKNQNEQSPRNKKRVTINNYKEVRVTLSNNKYEDFLLPEQFRQDARQKYEQENSKHFQQDKRNEQLQLQKKRQQQQEIKQVQQRKKRSSQNREIISNKQKEEQIQVNQDKKRNRQPSKNKKYQKYSKSSKNTSNNLQKKNESAETEKIEVGHKKKKKVHKQQQQQHLKQKNKQVNNKNQKEKRQNTSQHATKENTNQQITQKINIQLKSLGKNAPKRVKPSPKKNLKSLNSNQNYLFEPILENQRQEETMPSQSTDFESNKINIKSKSKPKQKLKQQQISIKSSKPNISKNKPQEVIQQTGRYSKRARVPVVKYWLGEKVQYKCGQFQSISYRAEVVSELNLEDKFSFEYQKTFVQNNIVYQKIKISPGQRAFFQGFKQEKYQYLKIKYKPSSVQGRYIRNLQIVVADLQIDFSKYQTKVQRRIPFIIQNNNQKGVPLTLWLQLKLN